MYQRSVRSLRLLNGAGIRAFSATANKDLQTGSDAAADIGFNFGNNNNCTMYWANPFTYFNYFACQWFLAFSNDIMHISDFKIQLNHFLYFSELSDTQRELQQLARKFTKEEIIPKAAEYDKTMEYPWDILKKAWSIGLLNGFIPEKYGNWPRNYIPLEALGNFAIIVNQNFEGGTIQLIADCNVRHIIYIFVSYAYYVLYTTQ